MGQAVPSNTTRRALFGGALGLASAAGALALPAIAATAVASRPLSAAAFNWIGRFEEMGGTFHFRGSEMWIGGPVAINLVDVTREIKGPLRDEICRQVRTEQAAGLRDDFGRRVR